MYNRALEVFLVAAETHSFSKAGEELYISPGAVMKQINRLEEHLGIVLFNRSNRGLTLTEAGKLIHLESQSMIQRSQCIIEKARALAHRETSTIRIGSSLMRPSQELLRLWQHERMSHEEIVLEVISFDDEESSFSRILDRLGENIDVICAICPSTLFDHRCNVLHIGYEPVCCAVPCSHPLASKPVLEISDLLDQDLIMIRRGDTAYIDHVRDHLELNYPQIHIMDVDKYEVQTMNYCNATGSLMITASVWKDVHPSLVTLPVKWNFVVPWGVLYPLQPAPHVAKFIELIDKCAVDSGDKMRTTELS